MVPAITSTAKRKEVMNVDRKAKEQRRKNKAANKRAVRLERRNAKRKADANGAGQAHQLAGDQEHEFEHKG